MDKSDERHANLGINNQSPVDYLRLISESILRIANQLDGPLPEIVGTPYVANRLGCTTDWIAIMVREGEIPRSCVVRGTGNGKPWRFHRTYIDRWIESR